jgi:ribosomal protein S18 acetylase RimI-like enzyme
MSGLWQDARPDHEGAGMHVRTPVTADAEALGSLHVRAWQRAYRSLMPDDYLDGLSIDDRNEMWATALGRDPRIPSGRLVAEDDGEVVGFIIVGPAGGEEDSAEGEVYALNVDPDAWGRGAGQALLAAGEAALRSAGFAEAMLWVHPGNERARRFYERAGWRDDGAERDEEVLGVETPEVRYRKPPT